MSKLHAKHQEQVIHLDRYAEGGCHTACIKTQRFIIETNFYNSEDAILRLCEELRKGEKPSQKEIDEAFEAEPTSHYAHAVRMGFGYLISASSYFTGAIDEETLKDQLDVGKKVEMA